MIQLPMFRNQNKTRKISAATKDAARAQAIDRQAIQALADRGEAFTAPAFSAEIAKILRNSA